MALAQNCLSEKVIVLLSPKNQNKSNRIEVNIEWLSLKIQEDIYEIILIFLCGRKWSKNVQKD